MKKLNAIKAGIASAIILGTMVTTANIAVAAECQEFTATNSQHQNANPPRAYAVTEGGYWWTPGTTTYYAMGSSEVMGTQGYATVTLNSTTNGIYNIGPCEIVDDAPVIEEVDVNVDGDVVTITGTASDANDDIEVVIVSTGGIAVVCEGTEEFTCVAEGALPGQYSGIVVATDAEGNESIPYEINYTVGDSQCVTASNADHVLEGRAVEKWGILVYAAGSNEYLGTNTASSSIEETGPEYWTKVSSCN